MREIKFRAWSIKFEEYIEDVIHDGSSWLEAHGYDYVTVSEIFDGDEFILEQYTGLKDKNGKEIYEGDILQGKNNKIYEVSFSDGYTKFESNSGSYGGLLRGYIDEFEMRIIGNIHENPELLEEEE